ncbi:MAG: TIGR03943 family protein [Candidatus Ratteibacteria bacterium]|nr:TIGR03943 family protein [Candidatus Ratteibacteria bacterium]
MEVFKKRDFYQALTIFIWILFLFFTVATGKLEMYINKRFFPLTIIGLLVLLALFINKIKRVKKEDTEDINIQSSLSFIALLFPVLLAVVVRPCSLPGLAASKRGISQEFAGGNVMEILKTQLEMEGNYKKLNIKQVLILAKEKPEEIDGKAVSVEGFVFKQKDPERFILVRFLITCCAADATPLGIDVLYSNTRELKQDSWVKVYGKCRIEEDKIIIMADDVKETQKPSNVYLY